ncbi:unnamed protein product, partial [marine sediment metagenome]
DQRPNDLVRTEAAVSPDADYSAAPAATPTFQFLAGDPGVDNYTTIGADSVTFARAGVATYVDADGVLQEASAGELRSEASGTLLEYSNENMVKQTLFAASWSVPVGGDVMTPSNATGPDGTMSALTMVADGTDAEHMVSQTVYKILSVGTYAVSIYAKAGNKDYLRIFLSTASSSAYFKLSDCSVGTTANIIDTFTETLANGWCRVGYSFSGSTGWHGLKFTSAAADNDPDFEG